MPLTVQEAQLVSWKVFRKIHDKLGVNEGKTWNPLIVVADMMEEAGEVASIVKGLEGFETSGEPKTKEMLASRLSDTLYSIFVLAEHYGVNLEDTFLEQINEYFLKFIA